MKNNQSTLVEALADGRDDVVYRTLDDSLTRSLAIEDPAAFAASAGEGLLIVDEIQRAPGLLLRSRPASIAIDALAGSS